jgi:hypothetical protein
MNNIYIDKKLPYPLTQEEYKIIDKIWEFNKHFKFITPTYYEYRNTLIKNIPKKYNIEEFFLYEKILEKLYWNLHNLINKKLINNLEEYKYDKLDEIKEKFHEDNNFRSYINKIINYDDINNKIYYCRQQGGEPVSEYNKTNHLINDIMTKREIYEKVMNGEQEINKIKLSKNYKQIDYGFPNLNIYKPFIGSDEWRKKKIEYYYYKVDFSENNWFVLLNPSK